MTILPTPLRVGALAEYTGEGVTMAYVDSGFSRHADIEGRVIVHADASTHHVIETPHVVEISPLSWHGQMTSVIGSGDGRTSNGLFKGIAHKSKLVLVKVSTPDGRIKEADILRGLRWLYDTRHRYNVKIVNVSVGGDFLSNDAHHALHVIVKKLHHAGITVVISAGNANGNFLVPPASAPEALSIGGYDDQNSLDNKTWTLFHHNHGTSYDGTAKPELLAPAAWIASPLLPDSATAQEIAWLGRVLQVENETQLLDVIQVGWQALGIEELQTTRITDEIITHLQSRIYHHKVINSHYQHVDGTSVAAPIVASVIAQMLEANPRLSPNDVRHILQQTAQPNAHFAPEKQGAGLLNAREAVLRAKAFLSSLAG